MSDRSVSVKLDLSVAGFLAGVEQAKLATKDFATSAEKSATEHRQSWDKVGKGMMLTGGVIALGVGMAIKAYADFSKEMSGVQAVSGASASEMDKLGKAAIKAGADTVFSASEAAKAEGELAKAGVKTADILGGALTGSLNLASAGGLDLANAATISAQAMNIFKLKGQDVSHIADVMASAANKSAADVAGLGDALKQGGLIAAQTGLSLEDTVGTLAAFADNALIGSDAGTALKTMLQRLVPQSVAAQNAMDDIGFSAYDSTGAFVGMESVAQQLKTGLGGLTDQQRASALTTIFGSDAVRGANILMEQGAAGVKKYTEAVNDQGAAQRMASIMLNNLSGDFEALKGSIDTALIQSGSAGNGVLRDMVQGATSAVNAFGNLPAPLQQGALGFAAVTAAALLTGGAVLTIVPKIASTKIAMAELGVASKLTKASMMSFATGPIGVALAGITLAVGLFAKSQMDAKGRADDLRASLDQQTGAITAQTRALVAKQLQEDGAFKVATRLGVSVQMVTDAAMGQGHALEYLRGQQAAQNDVATATIAKTTDQNNKMGLLLGTTNVFSAATTQAAQASVTGSQQQAAGYGELLAAVLPINGAIAGQTEQQKELGVAVGDTTGKTAAAKGATQDLTQSEKELAAAADENKKAHDALTASITGYGSAMMAARGDARSYEAAIDAATAALKENGRTLDIGTEKGRANQTALDGIATSALKMAESNLAAAEANGTLGKASKGVTADVGAAREAFINSAVSMGMNRAEAGRLADQSGLTASRVKEITDKLIALGAQNPKPNITLTGIDAAITAADRLEARLNALPRNTNLNVHTSYTGGAPGQGHTGNNANGTDNWRGGPTWVGERGPEILNLPQGSQVIPNHKTAAYMTAAPVAPRYVSDPSHAASPARGAGNGATSADIRALGDRFGAELSSHSRLIQTMQRQMAR